MHELFLFPLGSQQPGDQGSLFCQGQNIWAPAPLSPQPRMGGPGGSAPRLEKKWRFKGAKTPFLTKVFLTPPSPEPAQVAATHSETQPRRRQTHKHHVELTGNCDARTDATTAHTAHGDRCKAGTTGTVARQNEVGPHTTSRRSAEDTNGERPAPIDGVATLASRTDDSATRTVSSAY